MYFKKILLLFLLMICVLFTVSGISAGDVDDAQDIASLSDVEEELDVSIDNPVDGDLLEQDSGDEVISAAQSSSWTELNTLINGNNNDYIELTKDYNFYNDKYDKQFQTGIPIKRSLTIEGNWHILNANSAARIFHVEATDIVFKNIIFIHGKSTDGSIGGAITVAGSVNEQIYTAINCSFISNQNAAMGGGNAINCYFLQNTGSLGGATFMSRVMENCTFRLNYATSNGGAVNWGKRLTNCIFIDNRGGGSGSAVFSTPIIENCTFIRNTGSSAVHYGNVTNCIFINNTGWGSGGAVFASNEYSAINCTVIGNHARSGGAIANINAIGCEFIDNTADQYGGAVYNATAIHCTFRNNHAGIDGDDGCNITITKNPVKLTAPGISVAYNTGYLTITLKDDSGNPIAGYEIAVTLNGKTSKMKTNSNGQVKVSAKGLAPKTYSASVTFDGDMNYAPAKLASKVIVNKATPKMTAKVKTFKKSVKTKKYAITLKTNLGKALNKAKVTIKVNGKTYKATTNTKGKATFKITKLTKKGTFKSKVTFKGDKYYKKFTKTVKIKIK